MTRQKECKLTVKEIHEVMSARWPAEHKDILEFIEGKFDFVPRPTKRWYRVALTAKRKGRDWRYVLATEWLPDNPEYTTLAMLHYSGLPPGRPMEKLLGRLGRRGESMRKLLPQYQEARKLLAAS